MAPRPRGLLQFSALLRKNFTLQTRSRKTILGIGGWGALLVQLVLPAVFFALMCIPKYYIKPMHHTQQLTGTPKDLDLHWWWSTPDQYDGPALDFDTNGGKAHVVLAPDTPAVRAAARVLARALACPSSPTKRSCPLNLPPSSFHCMFIPDGVPPQCQDASKCMDDEACWGPLLTVPAPTHSTASQPTGVASASFSTAHERPASWSRSLISHVQDPTTPPPLAQITIVADEATAMAKALERPARVDALVLFMATLALSSPTNDVGRPSALEEGQPALQQKQQQEQAVDMLQGWEAEVEEWEEQGRWREERLEVDFRGTQHLMGQSVPQAEQDRWRHGQRALRRAVHQALKSNDLFGGGAPGPEEEGDDTGGAHGQIGRAASADGGSRRGSGAGSPRQGAGSAAESLLRFTIRMNHTDIPDTRFLLDLFEVVPSRTNSLALYQKYWFFTNLQLCVQRAVLGMRREELRAGLPSPPPAPPPSPSVDPAHRPPEPSAPAPEPDLPNASAASPAKHTTDALASTHAGAGGTEDGGVGGSAAPGGEGMVSPGVGAGGLGQQLYEGTLPLPLSVSIKPFPWPAVDQDLGSATAAVFFNLLMVYAFLSPARGVVGGIVREKELRLREGMRLMGLSEAAYWGSWFVTNWSSLLLSALLCALIGLYCFGNTSFTLMVVFFTLFTAALVCFSYFISTVFATSRIAGAGAQFLYALAMLPGFIAPSVAPYAGTFWYVSCALPPGAASLWAACLINWEMISRGLTWSTVSLPIAQGSGFSAATVLWFLGFDIVLYTLLAWYLDKVLPTSPTQRQHPLFFLRYLLRPHLLPASLKPAGLRNDVALFARVQRLPGLAEDGRDATAPMSPASTGHAQRLLSTRQRFGAPPRLSAGAAGGILVDGMVKVFPGVGGSDVVALDGAGFHASPGAITALLGHNGAGKTTLISILTGLESATAGHAWVKGLDVSRDMPAIRQDLGVCPQFDVLWPELTVEEHLRLHACIKGYSGQELQQVVAAAVREVGLAGSEGQLAGDLSGGQRRKLSLACALLGGPSIVMVDEPTSGMDPYTRRFTWDLLRGVRAKTRGLPGAGHPAGSAVLLTTHSMEEAEALADYVVIMAHGKVVAEGTPLELKSQFGEGYTLVVVAPAPQDAVPLPAGRMSEARLSGVDDRLLRLVQAHVPSAVLIGRQGTQVAFRMPREVAGSFPALLRELDKLVEATNRSSTSGHRGVHQQQQQQQQQEVALCVSSYGLSVTTLEEVFIRVTEGAEQHRLQQLWQQHQQQGGWRSSTSLSAAARDLDAAAELPIRPQFHHVYAKVRGARLLAQQAWALLAKRALCARREWLTLLTQLLVPLALVWLSLWASALSIKAESSPPLACDRASVLVGQPTAAAVAPDVRATTWPAWLDADAKAGGVLVDSGMDRVWRSGPAAGTLDGYLLNQWHSGRPFYDAVFLQQLPDASQWLLNSTVALDVWKASVMLNQTAVHAIPATISQLTSAAWQYLQLAAPPPAPSGVPQSFQVVNHPLPVLGVEPVARIKTSATGLFLVVCLTLASALMSASVAIHLVRERASKAKHVQLVSGAPVLLFWAANMLWDYLQFCMTAAGLLMLIALYQLPQFQGARLAAVALLLSVFGFAGNALTYVLQGLFTDEMMALQRLNTSYFLVGYLGFVATWIMDLILLFTRPALLQSINSWIKVLFRLLSPHFCFSRAVYDVSQTYKSDIPLPIQRETNPFAWSIWGKPMVYMAAQAMVYFWLAVLLDSGLPSSLLNRLMCALTNPKTAPALSRRRSRTGSHSNGHSTAQTATEEDGSALSVALLEPGLRGGEGGGLQGAAEGGEDEDVEAERQAVQARTRHASSQVLLDGVAKTFHRGPLRALLWGDRDPHAVRAVRGLWLGMARGECFGLLGINGAGKSTTFGMVTGEVLPDRGDAQVCDCSVMRDLAGARRHLGYCPQFESLLVAMSPLEVLTMYARLRGMPATHVPSVVSDLLLRLGLAGGSARRPCGTLSGGNKRKLALAVSLIGDPPVVLADEPSTGVDPGARRHMWTLLKSEVMAEGRALVLTSHSMDECEALCDRLAIMVAGRAACLGSPQHLKDRFGGGYLVDVRCKEPSGVQAVLRALRLGPCPAATLADVQDAHATYALPRDAVCLADLLEWLEQHKLPPNPSVRAPAPGGALPPPAAHSTSAAATAGDGDARASPPPPPPPPPPAGVAGAARLDERWMVDYSVRQTTLESVFLCMAHSASGMPVAVGGVAAARP